jgi:hypothetical protein
LKNAELGYTVRNNFVKTLGISSIRIYMNGSNLLTWDRMRFPGQDPEAPEGKENSEPYPLTRVYNVGVNVGF